MSDIDPQLSANYRQDILTPFFKYVRSAESFCLVGGASMGKTRLLDYLSSGEAQKYYLGDKSGQCWLIRVDMNRLSVKNEPWAFYELLLSSIVLEQTKHDNPIGTELVDLDAKVLQNHDPVLALRFFELAVNRLCQGLDLKLCFMLDEFDDAYKTLSREIFAQLRAVRDANKTRLCYAIFLRTLPERLRPNRDNESFYELLSRNKIGIVPYSKQDTLQILQQLEVRRDRVLTPAQRERFYEASGGHIGLIQAFLSIVIENPTVEEKIGSPGWMEWFGKQPDSVEECRKLWQGLEEDEKNSLIAIASGDQSKFSLEAAKLLFFKGLLKTGETGTTFFTPVFGQYVRSQC